MSLNIDQSIYEYRLPLVLQEYRRFTNSPEHKGKFTFAEDIEVPNPVSEQTTVFAPQSGIIFAGVLSNYKWGPSPNFKGWLNWINVYVGENEFYELAHVAPLPGNILKVGERIEKGEPILVTALNGFITVTDGKPDSHLHILVGRWLNRDRSDFRSCKIRWER